MVRSLKNKILLVRIKRQDPEAFAKLYDEYVKKMYRFVYFKVSSVEEAEDITSEVFLKAWQYISQKEGHEVKNLNAFLYQVARNLVIDHYRHRAHHEMYSLDAGPEYRYQLSDERQNPATAVSQELATKQIEGYLRRLKDEYREVVVLKHLEGYSTREVAEILGKKTGNIRVLLHRALKAISEMVKEEKEQEPSTKETSAPLKV